MSVLRSEAEGRQKCELIYCGSSEVDHIETGEICHDILFKKTTFSILFPRHLPRLTLRFYGPTKACTSICEHYEVIRSSSFICRTVMISAILSGQHVFFCCTECLRVNYFYFQKPSWPVPALDKSLIGTWERCFPGRFLVPVPPWVFVNAPKASSPLFLYLWWHNPEEC